MKFKKLVAQALIVTTLFASTAQAAATALPIAPGDFRDATEVAPVSQRLLRPLLRKILEHEVFKTEEGRAKLLAALDRAIELNREKALANIDRMSEEQLRAEALRSARRAEKDGNAALVDYFRSLSESPEGTLKEKLRALHSPERARGFARKIRDSIAQAGSPEKAVELMDGCWDYVPMSTEGVILTIALIWAIMMYVPALIIALLPPLVVLIALVPVALVVDYVVVFPFYLFLEIIPCEAGG